MKILWVKSDFLHPTNRGGQIRTLEILRAIHKRHEVDYVAFDNPEHPEGLARAGEYCSRPWPVPHKVPDRRTASFALQAIGAVSDPMPLSVRRYQSRAMANRIASLLHAGTFDSLVCDFLFPAPNIPDISQAVLFQHNVESTIWERHVANSSNPLRKAYFGLQSGRMRRFESETCRKAGHVIAVSAIDAERMKQDYGVSRISSIDTGVDFDYFAPPPGVPRTIDLAFLGSMDWLPNIDGVTWFVRQILPLIRRLLPDCSVDIVGRKPGPEIRALAEGDPKLRITGTVPDVRPFLWAAKAAIVPLRIGGGTRLKIYEAIAAGVPVISTSVGAEGLPLRDGEHVVLTDSEQAFADACVRLLENESERHRIACRARDFISSRFSWDSIALQFEEILARGPKP